MREMVKKHFTPEDYFNVRSHMIGTGLIGGKACGMLLARAIIRNSAPEVGRVLEPHDSFFVGSDVYYTYTGIARRISSALLMWNSPFCGPAMQSRYWVRPK